MSPGLSLMPLVRGVSGSDVGCIPTVPCAAVVVETQRRRRSIMRMRRLVARKREVGLLRFIPHNEWEHVRRRNAVGHRVASGLWAGSEERFILPR